MHLQKAVSIQQELDQQTKIKSKNANAKNVGTSATSLFGIMTYDERIQKYHKRKQTQTHKIILPEWNFSEKWIMNNCKIRLELRIKIVHASNKDVVKIL